MKLIKAFTPMVAAFGLLILATVTLAPTAFGAQAAVGNTNISFAPPTQYVDGSPILAGDLDHYDVHFGTSSGQYIDSIEIPDDGTTTDRPITITLSQNVSDGDTINMFVAMTATDDDGDTSGFSNEVALAFVVSISSVDPNPPGSVQVEMNMSCTADSGLTCTITPVN